MCKVCLNYLTCPPKISPPSQFIETSLPRLAWSVDKKNAWLENGYSQETNGKRLNEENIFKLW